MLNDTDQEDVYKPKWVGTILTLLFFGLGAIILGYAAVTNNRGIKIYGVVPVAPLGATIIYWIGCAVFAGMTVAGLFVTYRRVSLHRQEIRNRKRRRKVCKTKSQQAARPFGKSAEPGRDD